MLVSFRDFEVTKSGSVIKIKELAFSQEAKILEMIKKKWKNFKILIHKHSP